MKKNDIVPDLKWTYIDSCWDEVQGKKPANNSRNKKPQHNKSRSAERTNEASKTEIVLVIFGIVFIFLILAVGLSL